jgi:hypothetical protein
MIDTMQLMLTDYDARAAELTLQPASVNTLTGESKNNFALWHNGTETVEGAYAYFREGHFNVTIKPQFNPDGMGIGTACYVRFEVPKFAGESNYHPTDAKGTAEALQASQKLLKRVGIKTNVKTARISRLDAFKNIVAAEPFSCYSGVLALLAGSRMKKRGYENGFLWENTRQQICVYDKLRKMLHDKLSTVGLPENTLRFEHRMLQAQKVRDALEMATVADLLADYDKVCAVYQATMKRQLFRQHAKDIEILLASDIEREMLFFQTQYGKEWLNQYLRAFGLHSLLQKTNIETILNVVDKLAENRMKKSRLKRDLQKMQFDVGALAPVGGSKRTTGQLYQELQEKVLDA